MITTFDREHDMDARIKIPKEAWDMMGLDPYKNYTFTDLLGSGFKTTQFGSLMLEKGNPDEGLKIRMPTMSAMILKIEQKL